MTAFEKKIWLGDKPEKEQEYLGIYNPETKAIELKEVGIEGEKIKEQTVARIYLTQSRRSEDLEQWLTVELQRKKDAGEEIDIAKILADVDLTQVVLMLKDMSAVNPGQVMPVGGNAESKDKGDIEKTAVRELLQETHLRTADEDGVQAIGRMRYAFLHPKKGRIKNDTHFFTAHILPTDVPYPLDPKENKSKEFVSLSADKMFRLLHLNKISSNGGGENDQIEILDSLQVSDNQEQGTDKQVSSKNKSVELQADQRDVLNINLKMAETWQVKEIKKKRQIIDTLYLLLKGSSAVSDSYLMKYHYNLDNLDNLDKNDGLPPEEKIKKFRSFLSNMLTDLKNESGMTDDLVIKFYNSALDMANYEEEVEGENAGRSEREAVIRLMFTLGETRERYDAYFRVAKKNEHLRPFVEIMESFADAIASYGTGGPLFDPGSENEIGRDVYSQRMDLMKNRGELDDDRVEAEFSNFFLGIDNPTVSKRIVKKLRGLTNDFLDHVAAEGQMKNNENQEKENGKGPHFQVGSIDQLDWIKRCSLAELCRVAFVDKNKYDWSEIRREFDIKPDQGLNDEEKKNWENLQKRIIFEARRVLGLLYLLKKDNHYYEKKVKKSDNVASNELWNQVLTEKKTIRVEAVEPEELRLFLKTIEKDTGQKLDISIAVLRVDEKNYPLLLVNSFKTKESFIRKLFVKSSDRPESVQDLTRMWCIFLPTTDISENIVPKKIRVNQDGNPDIGYNLLPEDNGEGDLELSKTVELKDDQRIWDLLEVIEKNNKKHRNSRTKLDVVDYKPTPSPGEAIRSRSVGGGGDVRFSKFYLKNSSGESLEVMNFLKLEDLFHYYNDHTNYGFSRLFDTRTLRSFIDLFFPVQIYHQPVSEAINRFNEKRK